MIEVGAQAAQKKILIVEDEGDIRLALQIFLESEGYLVQTAKNGEEALQCLAREGLPALILLDMKMPVMNGWDFAKAFVAKYDHEAPILVMTAAADAQRRAAEIDARGWVGKPFDLGELSQKVQQVAS